MINKVTPKQKKFCDEYLVDLNATQAAIRAGYSAKNADKIGPELLGKTRVNEYITERMAARAERVEVRQDNVLKELSAIAFSNITDYLEVKEMEVMTGYEKGEDGEPDKNKPIMGQYKVVDIYETARIHKDKLAALAEIKQTKDGISIKMCDKLKALELLGRHLGMFKDNVNINGSLKVKKLEEFF
jgi:phage terminase small subunit